MMMAAVGFLEKPPKTNCKETRATRRSSVKDGEVTGNTTPTRFTQSCNRIYNLPYLETSLDIEAENVVPSSEIHSVT